MATNQMNGGGVIGDVRDRLTQDGWEREVAISVGSTILAVYLLSRVFGVNR